MRQLTRRRQAENALAQVNALLEKRVEEQSINLSKTSDELRLENIRRALAEKNERDQLEWWRITLNSIGDCVITTDIEGKINFVNRMAQDVTEWSLEEALGAPLDKVFDIVNEKTQQPVESPITKVLRDGVTIGLANHTSLITKSGRYVPIDDSGAPIRDDEGNIIGAVLIFRDFTQQRQAEIKLQQLEETQRLALEAGRMGIFAWNPKTDELQTDHRMRALFGINDDEVIEYAAPLFATVYEEDRLALNQNIKDVIKKQAPYNARFRVNLPDGTIRWIAGRGHVETDEQGKTIRLRGINYDITQQIEAEEKLRESEERYRLVAENASDVIITIDDSSTILYVNRAAERVFGYKLDEMMGQPLTMLMPEYLRHLHEAGIARYQATGTRHMNWEHVEIPGLHHEGHEIPLELSFSESRLRGKHVFIGIARDVSERRQAELKLRENEVRFRTLTETIPQLVWTCLPDGECAYLSNRWMEYTGTTLEQNLGYGWLQAVHPDDAAATQEVWAHAVATSNVYQTEFRLRRADNTYRWHLARAVKVKDYAGDTVKWFGTCTDIEDHKRSEVERTEMLEREQMLRSKAEEANRMKDEFVATVSHELRSPLNAILGWARMMRAGTLDTATTLKAIDVIERSADNQARLIDDLLDMSRIITGKLRLDLKTLDPGSFVRAALEAVTPTAKAKDITIQSNLTPNINAIAGDANRLQQVVWNLLSNAIKFTPKGGRINVQLIREASQIVFSVTDTGQGINPEFLPYVFDRFRQADATSIRKHGGLGLGLSIARHLVELHGGVITVESGGQDQGATFIVRLPILPVQLTNEGLEPETDLSVSLPAPNAEAILSGLFILAVDDEPDARQLLAQILKAYGATVTTTDTAESALEIIQQQQPDLLVSDIGMPNNDGYSLIRRVRESEQGQTRRLPAIALTAYARPRDRMQALAAGFNHHVPKPVEPAELVTVITSLTGRLSLSDS
jgi:PAS domain S-box-containing protein